MTSTESNTHFVAASSDAALLQSISTATVFRSEITLSHGPLEYSQTNSTSSTQVLSEGCTACTLSASKAPLDPMREGFFSDPARTKLIPLSVVDKIRKIPFVLNASGFLLFSLRDPRSGMNFTVGGFDTGNPTAVSGNSCQASDIISGDFIHSEDRGVALLEESFAISQGLKVGSFISLPGKVFPVKGIVRPGIRAAKAGIYLAFSDAEQVINTRLTAPLASEANIIVVEAGSARRQQEAMDGVRKILPECMIDTFNCFVLSANVMEIDEKASWLLIIIVLFASILFSAKSQMASVIERRHDIGILKAIGWTDRNIVDQILVESLFQAVVGGVLGCLAGTFLIVVPIGVLSQFQTGWNMNVTPYVLFAGFCVTLLSGFISGGVPAFYATREGPADSLRRF
ncbi:MAG: ABC transporter permease [Candidatus Riflebacteria bacterium]|nr:ABC transporter permease [Candidatus Riflebacteria bacterium]